MTTGHVFIGVSLDGFIARPDGDIGWLDLIDIDGEDHGYDAFMARMDGLVMGRNSFQKVLSFGVWPYEKPVIVLSNSLTQADVPKDLADKVAVWTGTAEEVMERLGNLGWQRAYVDGGQVIQSFLKAGKISEMVITRLPILIGQGIPLFGALSKDLRLRHETTMSFPSGFVQSRYLLDTEYP